MKISYIKTPSFKFICLLTISFLTFALVLNITAEKLKSTQKLELSILLSFIFFIILYCWRNLILRIESLKQEIKESQALQALSCLNLKLPFYKDEWVISPDLALILFWKIVGKKPKKILECGSGISTAIIAKAVETYKKGKLFSLENFKPSIKSTQEIFKINKLKTSNLLYAPLKKYSIKGGKFSWYSLRGLEKLEKIDFLFIDGPPGKNRRFAATLLSKKLSKKFTIIIDDAKRKETEVMVQKFEKNLGKLKKEFINNKRGALVLEEA